MQSNLSKRAREEIAFFLAYEQKIKIRRSRILNLLRAIRILIEEDTLASSEPVNNLWPLLHRAENPLGRREAIDHNVALNCFADLTREGLVVNSHRISDLRTILIDELREIELKSLLEKRVEEDASDAD